MKSLDQRLGELVTEMTPQALKQYRTKSQAGMSQETLVNIAESCVQEFPASGTAFSESRRIRRNNGATGAVDEAAALRQESDDLLTEAIARRDPRFAASIAQVKEVAGAVSNLTESQRREYEHCKMVGMSEADSLRAAQL
jgi:hypothetical protein